MARCGATVEKVTLTLPSDLMRDLRSLAPHEGLSSFIAEATRERFARLRLEEGLTAGFGAWASDDTPELATSETTSRFIHDLRRSERHYPFPELGIRRPRPTTNEPG